MFDINLTPDVSTSCSSPPQGGMKLILRDTPVNSWKRTCTLPPQSPMGSGYAEVGVCLVPAWSVNHLHIEVPTHSFDTLTNSRYIRYYTKGGFSSSCVMLSSSVTSSLVLLQQQQNVWRKRGNRCPWGQPLGGPPPPPGSALLHYAPCPIIKASPLNVCLMMGLEMQVPVSVCGLPVSSDVKPTILPSLHPGI